MRAVKPIRHKFNAKRTDIEGISFPSKKEAIYYKNLLHRQESGEVIFFLRQVPIHLPGNIKYVVDFVEFHADETVKFVDVKGMITPIYKLKKKLCEETYPFKIEEV